MSHAPASPPPQDLVEPTKQARDLPNEIIERIFALLDEHNDASTSYASCRLVSRRFDRLVKPYLFAHLDSHDFERLTSTSIALSMHPGAALDLIASLTLNSTAIIPFYWTSAAGTPALVSLDLKLSSGVTPLCLEAIRSCRNLERLGVVCVGIPGQLADVLKAVHRLPRLRELLLSWMLACDDDPTYPMPPVLQALHLRDIIGASGPEVLLEAFNSKHGALSYLSLVNVPPELAMDHSATLVHLHLEGGCDADLFRHVFGAASWPRLETFEARLDHHQPMGFVQALASSVSAYPSSLKIITLYDSSEQWTHEACEDTLEGIRSCLRSDVPSQAVLLRMISDDSGRTPVAQLKLFLLCFGHLVTAHLDVRMVPEFPFQLERLSAEQLVRKAAGLPLEA
ncbi:hypothetical protein JCM8097_007922 [Rhodosporidiobolus ruineniae]